MSELLLIPLGIIYLLVVSMLFVFGVNFFYLTYLTLRTQHKSEEPPEIKSWPKVTVQLPIYNEMYVAERLIRAAAKLDYPLSCFEIQVLDDSNDGTSEIISKTTKEIRDQGIQIVHVQRMERVGYKAGALAEGLKTARGEFVAIFDADFLPPPDFLKQTIPYFFVSTSPKKPPVAFIQTRWGHVNQDYSIFTYLQSLAIDAHFVIEQYARSLGGYWFNFNGTGGIWRRTAIESAGGWQADTLTEDLDISYRAYLKGWRAIYLRDVVVPAELPVNFSAYRRQQHRWAKGSLECAVKLLPQVWRAPLNSLHKIEATLHLTGYGVHLLLFCLTLLYPFVLLISRDYPMVISLFGFAALMNVTAFAPTIFLAAAQYQLGDKWWQKIPMILFITALGVGMILNTVRAAIQILLGGESVFERTPKFGISNKEQEWENRLYQLRLDPLVYLELGLALVNFATVFLALQLGNWVIAVYAALFMVGLLFVSGLTIVQSISMRIKRNTQSISSKAEPIEIEI